LPGLGEEKFHVPPSFAVKRLFETSFPLGMLLLVSA
jgi:hypothetical protein